MNPYNRQAKEYRTQEIMGASPIGLIVIAYDAAIAGCRRQDLAQATRALSALRNSLNFEHGEIASRLFALYVWCADLARDGKWEEAIEILAELRNAWAQAEKQLAATRSTSVSTNVPAHAVGVQLQPVAVP